MEVSRSDIDVYIETQDSEFVRELERISLKLSIISGKFDKKSPLGKEIILNHVVIQNLERYKQITNEKDILYPKAGLRREDQVG
jgi:hypothetical protein